MQTHTSSKTSGFALIVVLSLMAFIVLLLLSFTTLLRVEMESVQGSAAHTQAEQNALLALSIAIGQLQRDTGPDQRTTALAALNDGSGAAVSQPNWVGVYANSNPADYSQTPDSITPSDPVLLNWLVSGNEGTSYTASNASSDFGRIVEAPNSITHAPTEAITNLENATAETTLSIGNSNAKLLVGPNSTNGTNALVNYVAAPLVNIETNNGIKGRYAWWVGDEGVKAKVNLRPSYLEQVGSEQADYQNFAFLTAQRNALEVVDYDDSGTPLGAEFDFTDPGLLNVADLETLAFLGSNSIFDSIASERFHDLTGYGHGVLANAYTGGLKKDLTADLNGATGRPADSDPIFTPLNANDEVPTWGQLRSLTEVTGDTTAPILPSENSNGIYPVISMASLSFEFFISNPTDPLIPEYQVQVAMYPTITLWNPHSVTINAADYEVGFHVNTPNASSSPIWFDLNNASIATDTLDLYTGNWLSSATTNSNFIRFRLESIDIPPGESQIYAISDSGVSYEAGVTTLNIADEGLDKIISYVSWTSPNLAIPETEFNTGSVRVRSPVSINENGKSQSLDVVLAQPGGISDLNDTNQWYQAILDAHLYGRSLHPNNLPNDVRGGRDAGYKVYELLPTTAFADLPQIPSASEQHSFRIQMPMEARGGFASVGSLIGSLSKGGAGSNNNTGRLKWLVTGNPRAKIIRNTRVENEETARGNTLFGGVYAISPDGWSDTWGDIHFPTLGSTNGSRVSAGRGHGSHGSSDYGVAVLFDHLTSTDQFLSIGQLQHSLTGGYGFYSTYPFGNSWADVRIPRENHYMANTFDLPYSNTNTQTLYDLSWHMNRAIWDRYFVSTVPDSWVDADITSNRTLPNNRLSYYESPEINDLKGDVAYDKAAANLWLDGAFNINSTSEQAWRSLLSATFNIPDNGIFADSGDNVSEIAPIPRFSRNLSQTGYNNVDFTNTMKAQLTQSSGNRIPNFSYIGNRGLVMPYNGQSNGTVEEIVNELARTIVVEVRERGPFLSIGDFVNRSLVTESADVDENGNSIGRGIKGALQTAIDNMSNSAAQINSDAWLSDHGWQDSDDVGYMIPTSSWSVEHYLLGPDRGIDAQNQAPYSVGGAATPKHMTQADLLSVIGPALSARSDTFRIRTYGETLNPITQETEGRAWCEAIVQRIPEYLDSTDDPEIEPLALTSEINTQFGRKYKILSLRWLDASEI